MTHFPKIKTPVGLTREERGWVHGIVATRGANKGHLRASKPKVTRTDLGLDPTDPHGFYHIYQKDGGESAYIWRMVAFYASPNSRHHCMPCTAEMDLPQGERKELVKRLDQIVSAIVDAIPPLNQHGVTRWGHALGYL